MMPDSNWDESFRERFSRYAPEMKWLYMELYHNEQAFTYFADMLYRCWQERPESLRAWDRQRSQHPDWYRSNDMLGMQMYTNCFAGTIKGVEKHLGYLKETGVNYLHLMPLLESPEGRSDGGYAVSDFRKVNPALGTIEDLAELADVCHGQGISLCLDFVMNHTSEDHEWARKAKAGEKEYQDRYFFFDDRTIPDDFEKMVPEVFPTTAPGNFTWCEEAGKIVMTTFYPYQWDLNYGNFIVFNDMTENMLYLCNHGVDIVRLDAVPYIWKTLGTVCRNLPQVHTLVRIMHMAAEIAAPGTLLLGEVVMEPDRVVPYFGSPEKPECHMLYNVTTMASTWHTVATKDVRLLKHQLETVFALPKQYTFLNYLRCHDDIGWGLDYDFLARFGIEQIPHKAFLNNYLTGKYVGVDCRGELYNDDPVLGDARLCGTTASLCGAQVKNNSKRLQSALDLDVMLHAFLMTQSGIPVLYSGDEIGQLNDYSYHDDELKREDSRYLHRGDFSWDDAEKRNDPTSRQGKIYMALQKLIRIRKQYPVFDSDADVWIIETWNDHVLGIGRYYEDEVLMALFNFADREETAWTDEEEKFIDLMTGKPESGKAVRVPGHSFRWLYHSYRKDSAENTALPDEEDPAAEEA